MTNPASLPPLPLPAGISQSFIETESGLNQHILQAGSPEDPLCCCCTDFRNWHSLGATSLFRLPSLVFM